MSDNVTKQIKVIGLIKDYGEKPGKWGPLYSFSVEIETDEGPERAFVKTSDKEVAAALRSGSWSGEASWSEEFKNYLVKSHKKSSGGGNYAKNENSIAAAVALKCAVELQASGGRSDLSDMDLDQKSPEAVISVAEKFLKFLKENS